LSLSVRVWARMTNKTYNLNSIPNPDTRLVHIYPRIRDEIGRVYPPNLGITRDPVSIAAALWTVSNLPSADLGRLVRQAGHADYLMRTEVQMAANGISTWAWPSRIKLAMNCLMTWWSQLERGQPHPAWAPTLPAFLAVRGRIIGSTCGREWAISVPAAVGASIAKPRAAHSPHSVVGDGGFMMAANPSLAPAAQYGRRPIVLLFNNGTTARSACTKTRPHPERISGTTWKIRICQNG